jgi:hypothetical protein
MTYPTYSEATEADLNQLLEYWNNLPYATTPEETRIKNLIYDRMMILANKKTQKEKAHWLAFDKEQKKKEVPRERD